MVLRTSLDLYYQSKSIVMLSLGLDYKVSLNDHTGMSVFLATASTVQLVGANNFNDLSDSRLICHGKALFLFMQKIKKELLATKTSKKIQKIVWNKYQKH